jgi:mono/diheme cytochrome c family protein
MRLRALLTILIATTCLAQENLQPGLAATYSDGATRVRAVVAAPQFYLEPDESVHLSLKPGFQAEWTGLLSILQAGDYTFDAGGAELRINGASVGAKPVTLGAGRHPIAIRYRRTPGVARIALRWQAAHFAMEPVPASVLFHPKVDDTPVARGRYLAEELGCVNCHRSRSTSLEGRMGPDLTEAGSRLKREWLYKWLEAPGVFRSGAVMPGVASERDRRDIATYLVSLGPTTAARGRRTSGSGVGRGASLFGSIGCAACHQQELALDGMGSKTTAAAVAEYLKNPAKFDPGGRMPSLMLTDDEAQSLAAYLVDFRKPEFEQGFPDGDAARGKGLVESQGCIACHALADGTTLANRQAAPALEQLSAGRGCLAEKPGTHVPQYRLAAADRTALDAFLTWYRAHPDVSPAPVHRLEMKLRQLRCTACHEVDSTGPTATLAEATPPLTGAGAKLRGSWLDQVLTKRARVRRWQTLRMPDYDARHVGGMAAAFARAAGVQPGDGPVSPRPAEDGVARGAGLIGTDPKMKGMACIGCHDWGSHKSLGEEGPQLINTAERLRYDWYHRWMLNPARILSGTSMPNYFSSMDRRSADDVIETLWAALRTAEKLPLPAGLGKLDAGEDREALPVPDRRPIVVRWDMPEATPAAIAVGLPGKLSYCFDAGESRLRYAWRGGFVDLSETLLKKRDANKLTPTAKLVGEVFYRGEGFPLRTGAPDRVPQRRFRGYRLVDHYPEFRYEADGIEVSERIVASADASGLVRHFTLSKVEQPIWFIDGPRKIEIPRGVNVRFTVEVKK